MPRIPPGARLLAFAGLLAAGCAKPREPSTAADAPPPPRVRIPREHVDAEQSRPGAADLRFVKATSSACKPMRLVTHDGEAFVSYGEGGTFARLRANGDLDDLSLRAAVEPGELVVAIEAGADGTLYVRTRQVHDTSNQSERFFARSGGVWTDLSAAMRRNVDHIAPWLDGSVLASGTCYRDHPGPCEGLALQSYGGSVAAPRFPELRSAEPCSAFVFTAATDGRIVASGGLCPAPGRPLDPRWTLVRWSPDSGAAIDRIPLSDAPWTPGPLRITGPSTIVATAITERGEHPHTDVAIFDGAAWTLLPPVAGWARQLEVDGDGRPWLRTLDGHVVRYTADGAWARLGFPTDPVREFGGLQGAWAWVLQFDGTLWLRPAGGRFARATLRLPELGARDLPAVHVALVEGAPWVTVASGGDAQGRNRCTMLLRGEPAPAAAPIVSAAGSSW